MVYTINLAVCTQENYFHRITNARESPLFRTLGLCLCVAAIAQHIGGGVVCFTIVAFLPLIYVRVSERLPSLTAVYASIFILLTFVHSTMLSTHATTAEVAQITHTYIHWVLLFIAILYHTLWSSSHRHIPSKSETLLLSSFFVRREDYARPSTIPRTLLTVLSNPTAISRTLMAVLCIVVRDTYTGSIHTGTTHFQHTIYFLRILFLLLTISTFLSWTHCQHSHRNSLSSVLAASVVTAACGILVENVEQSLFLCLIALIAVWGDIRYKHDIDIKSL
jgi:MFS family permease